MTANSWWRPSQVSNLGALDINVEIGWWIRRGVDVSGPREQVWQGTVGVVQPESVSSARQSSWEVDLFLVDDILQSESGVRWWRPHRWSAKKEDVKELQRSAERKIFDKNLHENIHCVHEVKLASQSESWWSKKYSCSIFVFSTNTFSCWFSFVINHTVNQGEKQTLDIVGAYALNKLLIIQPWVAAAAWNQEYATLYNLPMIAQQEEVTWRNLRLHSSCLGPVTIWPKYFWSGTEIFFIVIWLTCSQVCSNHLHLIRGSQESWLQMMYHWWELERRGWWPVSPVSHLTHSWPSSSLITR